MISQLSLITLQNWSSKKNYKRNLHIAMTPTFLQDANGSRTIDPPTIAPHKLFSVLYLVSDYPFLTLNSIALLYFHAKVMMQEFVLVTKQTIYVYLSWQRILMIQDAESFGFYKPISKKHKNPRSSI
jgi:hypothetical protein